MRYYFYKNRYGRMGMIRQNRNCLRRLIRPLHFPVDVTKTGNGEWGMGNGEWDDSGEWEIKMGI